MLYYYHKMDHFLKRTSDIKAIKDKSNQGIYVPFYSLCGVKHTYSPVLLFFVILC